MEGNGILQKILKDNKFTEREKSIFYWIIINSLPNCSIETNCKIISKKLKIPILYIKCTLQKLEKCGYIERKFTHSNRRCIIYLAKNKQLLLTIPQTIPQTFSISKYNKTTYSTMEKCNHTADHTANIPSNHNNSPLDYDIPIKSCSLSVLSSSVILFGEDAMKVAIRKEICTSNCCENCVETGCKFKRNDTVKEKQEKEKKQKKENKKKVLIKTLKYGKRLGKGGLQGGKGKGKGIMSVLDKISIKLYKEKVSKKKIIRYWETYEHHIKEIIDTYCEKIKKIRLRNGKYRGTLIKSIGDRIEMHGYTKKEIIQTIEGFSRDRWWMKECYKYGPEWFFTKDSIFNSFVDEDNDPEDTWEKQAKKVNDFFLGDS